MDGAFPDRQTLTEIGGDRAIGSLNLGVPIRCSVCNDVAAKTTNWKPRVLQVVSRRPRRSERGLCGFHRGAHRWSSSHGVEPDPMRGLWAAALARDGSGWIQSTTFPQSTVAAIADSSSTARAGVLE